MMHRLLVIALSAVLASIASAQEAEPSTEPEPTQIRVGTKIAPPFVVERDDGTLGGLAIELLEAVAADVGFTYELTTFDLPDLLDATAAGDVDLAVGAITITAERESRMDFTYSYYDSGLAIAVRDRKGASWLAAIRNLFSPAFISAVGALVVILLIAGALMWFVEHKKNAEQFGGKLAHGIGNGFWWSAVTMTTVGYGDKAPITLAGRLVALVWMFASIIVISGFTAAIATSLTLSGLGTGIESPSALAGRSVGAIEGSTSVDALRSLGARVERFESGEQAIAALAAGDVEAVVHDEPVLRWWLATSDEADGLGVLPVVFEPQDYGFALPEASELREDINRAVLSRTSGEAWRERVSRAISSGGS